MTKKIVEKDFEASLERLEELVHEMESGKLTLEEGMKKFEEGTLLYKSCKEKLGDAQKKITLLTESLKEEEIE